MFSLSSKHRFTLGRMISKLLQVVSFIMAFVVKEVPEMSPAQLKRGYDFVFKASISAFNSSIWVCKAAISSTVDTPTPPL